MARGRVHNVTQDESRVKRTGFDLGECLELSNKRIFYTVIFCSIFLTQRKRTKYDQQNQSRDYSYMERNYKMMVWTQMYGLLNVVL